MGTEKTLEEVYIKSARKLRTSLPKFVIFLGIAYLIWLIGTSFFIPLSHGKSLGAVEVVSLDSLIILAAVLSLIFASFVEIRKVADGCAGLAVAYVTHGENKVEEVRLSQLKRSFRNIGYTIPFVVAFFIFSKLLEQINPLLIIIIPILIAVWVVIAAVLLAMVLGLEIEAAAKQFADRIEKRIKKRTEASGTTEKTG
jgi:uncharacterized protein YacL